MPRTTGLTVLSTLYFFSVFSHPQGVYSYTKDFHPRGVENNVDACGWLTQRYRKPRTRITLAFIEHMHSNTCTNHALKKKCEGLGDGEGEGGDKRAGVHNYLPRNTRI